MAITRSQQAKQMLQDGGMLVKPGFGGTRQGYRGPGGYQGGATNQGGAGKDSGVDRGGSGDAGNRFTQFTKDVLNPQVDTFQQAYKEPGLFGFGGGYRDLNVASDTSKGFKRGIGSRILGGIFGAINPALGFAFNTLASVPKTFQTFKDSPTLEAFRDNLRGYGRTRPTIFNNPNLDLMIDEEDNEYDFSDITNQEAKLNKLETREYNTLQRGKELDLNTPEQNKRLEELEEKKQESALTDRAFVANGGRIEAQEGGIMPRLNQLGSGVSSAEQMLQGINQRLESAESSLGEGGGNQMPAGFGANRPVPEFMQSKPQNLEPLQQADPNSPLLGVFQSRPENTTGLTAAIPPGTTSNLEELYPNAGQNQINFFRPENSTLRGGIPAAGYANGGNVVGGEYDFESARQMYGLGKLVKKVTRTVKKIAKSPVGKVAIAAGIAGLPFGGGKFFGSGSLFGKAKTFFGAGSLNPLLRKTVGGDIAQSAFGSMLSGIPGGAVTAGIVGASALAGLLTPAQEEEAQELARGEGIDIEAARRSILNAGTSQDFRAVRFRADGSPKEGEKGNMKVAGYLDPMSEKNDMAMEMFGKQLKDLTDDELELLDEEIDRLRSKFMAEGGSTEKEPVAKKTMPLLDMGGKEMDLRAEGGFVPIGRMEKADDVPARLSKNEFVFTADAVRNAGDGDVDKGAEVMYNMMKNLEAGGDVSEESQGLEGARKMFQTSQRLEEVL